MNEIPKGFKVIPDFPNYYINKVGKVWSGPKQGNHKQGKFLILWANGRGYLSVSLCKLNEVFVRHIHRLVLETFIGPCPKGMECCHNNDNKLDNTLKNLRWDTRSNNAKDVFKNGKRDLRGEKHPRAKLNSWQMRIIKRLLEFPKEFTQKEVGALFGVSRTTVNDINKGRTWIS